DLDGDLDAHRMAEHHGIRDSARAQIRGHEIGVPLHGERADRLGRLAEAGQVEPDHPAAEPLDEIEVDAAAHADAVQQHDRARAGAEILVHERRSAVLELPEICEGALRGEQAFRHPSTLSTCDGGSGPPPRQGAGFSTSVSTAAFATALALNGQGCCTPLAQSSVWSV